MTHDFRKEAEELETTILALTTAMFGVSVQRGDANTNIIQAALQSARDQALEDAAKVADDYAEKRRHSLLAYSCAQAIRALKGKQP